MDFGSSMNQIFNIIISMLKAIGTVWDWLFDTHILFSGLKFDIFSYTITIIPAFSLTPMAMFTGAGLISLMVLWLIKGLVPMG